MSIDQVDLDMEARQLIGQMTPETITMLGRIVCDCGIRWEEHEINCTHAVGTFLAERRLMGMAPELPEGRTGHLVPMMSSRAAA